MRQHTETIAAEEVARQLALCSAVRELLDQKPGARLACIDTYGCQQNEADSERLRGFLREMGYGFTTSEAEADLVLLNTCAIRAHAEDRVFGKLGTLTHTKRNKPGQIICVCGCMAQEAGVAERIQASFRHVDLVFGTHLLWSFPALLLRRLSEGARVFEAADSPGSIVEGLPVVRQNKIKAWVSIMYGCNNFCSYCIVPYVRGRERSRESAHIVAEVRALVAEGYREITLLGQNVNSYGRDRADSPDFSALLIQLNAIEGDFLLRFMTSHPKDASERLFDAMAACEKVAPQLHLPFQSGATRVLTAMNRGYTREHYLSLLAAARARMPKLVISSDVIVGFPGETQAEFEETLSLLEAVRFDALFTFLFSPRTGTPAASLPDPMPSAQKSENFQRLLALQNSISAEIHQGYIGQTIPCLIDGQDDAGALTARTPGARLVRLAGEPALIGRTLPLRITAANTWALVGEVEVI